MTTRNTVTINATAVAAALADALGANKLAEDHGSNLKVRSCAVAERSAVLRAVSILLTDHYPGREYSTMFGFLQNEITNGETDMFRLASAALDQAILWRDSGLS